VGNAGEFRSKGRVLAGVWHGNSHQSTTSGPL
jgi:hypothetical protein